MTEGMKAIRAHDYGDLSVLALEEVERPEPGNDQVLIRVKAAGVNPADWKFRAGRYQQRVPLRFPWTPGLEAAGVVEHIGPGIQAFHVGDEVYGSVSGAYAQFAVSNEKDVQPKPPALSFEEAAAVPVGALTAWGAIITTADVKTDQRVLVHGAAGGLATMPCSSRFGEAHM